MPLVLAHFSDIHLTSHPLGWTGVDFASKRVSGWINMCLLGRGKHFRDAPRILQHLVGELDVLRPDHRIFSGDASGLGFESEIARAASLLHVNEDQGRTGLAIPGNHDYYTSRAVQSGCFERYFGPWQKGDRIGAHTYPFAQKVGSFWFVAVNSSTPNLRIFNASGEVGSEQLSRLEALLSRLSPEPRILVTHYPICLWDGSPEKHHRRLRDLPRVLDAVSERGVCLWLHGHRHQAYHLQDPPHANFPVICAGSATQEGRASYGIYEIEGNKLIGRRRGFSFERDTFEDVEEFELRLAT